VSQPTVLVVEDEASFVEALQIGLSREGFRVEIASDGKSERKLLSRICFAASGRKGSTGVAIAIEIMLPKLALVVMQMYLSVLAKVARPSTTPRRRTSRSGCSSTTSALSRATSTARSTEMPTSAACSAGASLMPSPR